MSSNSSSGETAAGGHGPGNSTGSNSGHGGPHGNGEATRRIMFLQRQIWNEHTATYFAASICGIIAVFILLHWTRRVCSHSRGQPSALTKPFVLITRRVRNLLVRGAPGFNSLGHGLLVTLYVAINFVLILTNTDKTNPGHQASRFGWVLTSNMCFVVFLALKNTPLAFLTPYSYERLNNLHQIAGCTTFLLMVLHSVSYTIFFWKKDLIYVMTMDDQIAGIVAGFLFLGLFVSAMLIRRFSYETFKVMHITCFVGSVIAVGFHRPDFAEKTPIIMCITGGMWATDRLLRTARWLFYFLGNDATVYPLPQGGTRIVFKKRPAFAVPGKHCYVWIPRIRKFEMHPFTVIATQPLEFVVKSYNGFTRDLHAYAQQNPGATLRASLEGPYGKFPDPMAYDKIVLIAGGSGASYTIGLAVNLLERMGPDSTKDIVFIWTAKDQENLSWFGDHLETLRTHTHAPKVHVSLFVTRLPGSSSSGVQADPAAEGTASPTSPRADPEKAMFGDADRAAGKAAAATAPSPRAPRAAAAHARDFGDVEKDLVVEHRSAAQSTVSVTSSTGAMLRHAVSSGRPNLATLVGAAVADTPRSNRVLVAACGPAELMRCVRDETARAIRGDGPGVELHCEQFGW